MILKPSPENAARRQFGDRRSQWAPRRAPIEQVHKLSLQHMKLVYYLAGRTPLAVREILGFDELVGIGSSSRSRPAKA